MEQNNKQQNSVRISKDKPSFFQPNLSCSSSKYVLFPKDLLVKQMNNPTLQPTDGF